MSKHRNNTYPCRNVANSLFTTKLRQSRHTRLGKYTNTTLTSCYPAQRKLLVHVRVKIETLAHMKVDGSAILLASCDINDTENFNKSCAASEFDFYHLNAKGDTVCSSQEDTDCTAPAFKSTLDDFLTNSDAKWAHGDYAKDKLDPRRPFFAGEGDLAAKRVKIFTASVPDTPTPAKDQEEEEEKSKS